MAQTKCTTRKVFNKKPLKHLATMTMLKKWSMGGRACCHNPLETEVEGSPLTMPPSSPIPDGGFLMEAVLIGSQEAPECFGVPYTHNHVSTFVLITYFC